MSFVGALLKVPGGQGTDLQLSYDTTRSRDLILGKTAVPGSFSWAGLTSFDSGDNRDLHKVIVLSGHPVNGLTGIWVDGKKALSSRMTHGVRTVIPAYNDGKASRPRLWVTFYDGRPSQTADPFLTGVGARPFPWRSTDRLRGCAYAVVTMRHDNDVLRSELSFRFEVEGAKLYDRRLDSTAGGAGTQRWTSPSTWVYTDNAAVADDHYKLGMVGGSTNKHIIFGMGRRLSDGTVERGISDDFEEFQANADLCDEVVSGISRYAVNGTLSAGDDHVKNLNLIARQMAARPYDDGGRIRTRPVQARPIVLTLTDDDLVGGTQFGLEDDPGSADIVNTIRGTYLDPASGYKEISYPFIQDTELVGLDGREFDYTLDLPLENNVQRAQRIAKIELEIQKRRDTIDEHFMPISSVLKVGDWFERISKLRGDVTKIYEVVEPDYLEDFTTKIMARETDPSVSAWGPEDARPVDLPNAPDPLPPETPAPPTSSGQGEADQGGGAETPGAVITVSPPASEDFESVDYFEAEYGKSNGLTGASLGILAGKDFFIRIANEGQRDLRLPNLLPSTVYAYRIRTVAGVRFTDWGDYQEFTTPANLIATNTINVGDRAASLLLAQLDNKPNNGEVNTRIAAAEQRLNDEIDTAEQAASDARDIINQARIDADTALSTDIGNSAQAASAARGIINQARIDADSALGGRIDTTNTSVAALSSRTDQAEADIVNVQTVGNGNASDITALTVRTDDAETDIVAARQVADGAASDVVSLSARTDSAETDIIAARTVADGNATDITALSSRTGQVETDIVSARSVADGNASDIVTLSTRTGNAETDIVAARQVADGAASDLTALTVRTDQAETDITSARTVADGAASDITALTVRTDQTETDIVSARTVADGAATDVTALTARTDQAETDITSARGVADGAASDVTALTVRTGATETNVSSLQSASTTQASSITALKAAGQFSPNIMDNTRPEVLPNYSLFNSDGIDPDLFDGPLAIKGESVFRVRRLQSGQNVMVVSFPPVRVVAGQRLNGSVYVAAVNCRVGFEVRFRDENQGNLGSGLRVSAGAAGGDKLSDYDRINRFFDTPAGAATATFSLRVDQVAGNDPFMLATRWMLASVTAEQTDPPPYVPGTGLASVDVVKSQAALIEAQQVTNTSDIASVTSDQQLTAQRIDDAENASGATLTQTMSAVATGRTGSAQFSVEASTSDANTARLTLGAYRDDDTEYNGVLIEAQQFGFRSLSGGGFIANADAIFATVPIVSESPDGNTWVVRGNGFGANSDLLRWEGPNLGSPNACTRQNGDTAFTTNRQIWQFGAQLGAAAVNTNKFILAVGTVTETGIGSNGNTKTVTASSRVTANKTSTQPAGTEPIGTTQSTNGSGSVILRHRVAGDPWTTRTTVIENGTVTRTVTQEGIGPSAGDQTVVEEFLASASDSVSFATNSASNYEAEAESAATVPSGFLNIEYRTTIATSEA